MASTTGDLAIGDHADEGSRVTVCDQCPRHLARGPELRAFPSVTGSHTQPEAQERERPRNNSAAAARSLTPSLRTTEATCTRTALADITSLRAISPVESP